jgi:hypothetical protein
MNLTRRSHFIAFILIILGPLALPKLVHAQIQQDTTHWNDEDLYSEDKSSPAFFSVGGGAIGAYFKPDLTSFNANVAQPFVGQNIAEHVWMFGGQGFITLPWIKNFRVGGMGMSGTSDCGCLDTTVNNGSQSVGRFLDYEVGYGALTLDYVLPLRTGHFHIIPGVALGYGTVNIYARQAANRLDFDLSEFDGNSAYTTHTYSSHFFLYMPQLQFEFSPVGFLMFRLTAGYQGTSMGSWTVDQGVSLGNTTALSSINGSGFTASLGVFLGLFQ